VGRHPAAVILIFPLGFRLTCYYYRKAYYRSWWLSPPACAVPEPHRRYTGETRFPLLGQNLHRYFFYAALVFNVILTWDAVVAFDFGGHIGIGVGSGILVVNAVLLWLYSLSCHACRHAVGGRINHYSRHPIRYKAWTFVSRLNPYHGNFAWLSLVWVALTDLYVRLTAAGVIHDDVRAGRARRTRMRSRRSLIRAAGGRHHDCQRRGSRPWCRPLALRPDVPGRGKGQPDDAA
jgi:hypothetical protein